MKYLTLLDVDLLCQLYDNDKKCLEYIHCLKCLTKDPTMANWLDNVEKELRKNMDFLEVYKLDFSNIDE